MSNERNKVPESIGRPFKVTSDDADGSGAARGAAAPAPAVPRRPRRESHVLPCFAAKERYQLSSSSVDFARCLCRPASIVFGVQWWWAAARRVQVHARGMLRGASAGAGAGGALLPPHARASLFDSCHRKIRLIGGGPVAFLGGLVA